MSFFERRLSIELPPETHCIGPLQMVAESIGKRRINAVLPLFGSVDYLDRS